MRLREGGPEDRAACFAIYREAVLNGATHYSEAEREAWTPPDDDGLWMKSRLAEGITWIAEVGGLPAGFLTTTPDGHLDLFFVRAEHHGTGLAATLYDRFLGWADDAGRRTLTTFASHHARRFLEPRGWKVIEDETTLRNGVPLTRWRMALTRP